MPRYRVIDPDQNVIDEKEFADDTKAYDWFKTVEVPDDALGYAMEVDMDGKWTRFEINDGGTNTSPAADEGTGTP
ncbi:hypothetical protein [Dietzia sp. CH92]|uniref:hypothetical protein n=1 Tax=Dietzia sp. CH92 TaxID=3051823 RepID=UPI0028D31618|nr:hypothetical protein [Dietzia sp. CH92]